MNIVSERVRPLPVILASLRDELLSSWIRRHAAFYRVSSGHLLRHSRVQASPGSVDLALGPRDRLRIAELFRCDPRSILRMTHSRPDATSRRLIATMRTPQRCRRCHHSHRAHELTRGARLRSWTEGWRLGCPVCGSDLEDLGRGPASVEVNDTSWFAARVRAQASQGEVLLDRTLGRKNSLGVQLVELMRVLLLPRNRPLGDKQSLMAIPRLLNIVVPGFDDDAQEQHPDFRLPGTLLLPISIRAPLLAGVNRVAAQPERWAEPLLAAAMKPAQPRIWECLGNLSDALVSDAGRRGWGRGGWLTVGTARSKTFSN